MRRMLFNPKLIWTLILLSAAVGSAQDAADKKSTPKFPSNPAAWINSQPLSTEMLAGKAAVLFFFEETSQPLADSWQRLAFQAQKFDGTPVMFIGVNSGTSRPQLEAYLRKNNVKWPVICDSDRSFENQFGFMISSENVKQARLLMPDGKFKNADADNLEGSAVDASRDAKWRVELEPKDVPPVLMPVWMAIEFGRYPEAAQTLKKNLNGKAEIKEVATKLNQFVLDDLAGQIEAAKKSLEEGKKWDAFKRFSVIPNKFKGFTVPTEVTSNLKELMTDEAIKEEQTAMKQLDLAIQAASRSPTARKGALKQLEKLVKDHPDTEAAAEAQKLIEQAAAM